MLAAASSDKIARCGNRVGQPAHIERQRIKLRPRILINQPRIPQGHQQPAGGSLVEPDPAGNLFERQSRLAGVEYLKDPYASFE